MEGEKAGHVRHVVRCDFKLEVGRWVIRATRDESLHDLVLVNRVVSRVGLVEVD